MKKSDISNPLSDDFKEEKDILTIKLESSEKEREF